MNGYLYILETKGNHYYIGSTIDIERRINEHRMGKTKSLKRLLPIELVYLRECSNIKLARMLESKLKSFKNKNIIERIVKDQSIKLGI